MKPIKISIMVLSFSLLIGIICSASQIIESLNFNQTKLELVLQVLSKKTGIKLITGTELADKPITAYLENVSGEEAIDSILTANGFSREKIPGSDIYVVYSGKNPMQSQQIQSICLQLKHAFAYDIARELKSLGFEKNITVDGRTNMLVIKDTPSNIEIIRSIINQIDIEQKQSSIKTVLYTLKYVRAGDIWPIILSIVKKNKGEKDTDSKALITIDTSANEKSDIKTPTVSSSSDNSSGSTDTSSGNSSNTGSSGTGSSGTGTSDNYPVLTGKLDRTVSGKVQISTDMSTGFSVIPDERTNSLILVGTQDFIEEIKDIISSLDKPVPQVSIEAMIVELTDDASKSLGVAWGNSTVGLGTVTGGFNTTIIDTSGAATSHTIQETLSWTGLVANIHMLQTKGEANILANPRVTTLNGTPATIRITSRIPVAPKVTTVSTGGTGTTTNEYEFRDIGIILVAVPYVGDNNTVTMEVSPQVSAAKKSEFFRDAVETSERSTLTRVMVKDGETIVIGGLLSTENIKGENKVPGLGNVFPFLFSNKTKQMKKTDLVIFITPRIMTEEMSKKISAEEKARTITDKNK
ncbi:MAG TPA: secretin N-terminal domain-containing protein [Candidatus Ratteibacteria bacterium]|nr:secretin N-terminal domain-containing protein [bacterium]HRS06462.1 secretin N-terminal domain-containing protein [Candidatus Ratteibacteria bacterium]HRV04751.1 secretin N-terminal domain-containing protein [Candidatus Ratteibacteria bacterium]